MTTTPAKKSAKKQPAAAQAPAADSPEARKPMKQAILDHLRYTLAHAPSMATSRDWWLCVSLAVRDRLVDNMIATQRAHHDSNARRLYYLSLEYLMGRML